MRDLQDQVSESYTIKGEDPNASINMWKERQDAARKRRMEIETPPEQAAPLADADKQAPGTGEPGAALSPQEIFEQSKKGWAEDVKAKYERILDVTTTMVRPLGAFGAAAIAPFGEIKPDSGETASFLQDVQTSFRASGEALVREMFPTFGEARPDYGRKMAERFFGKGLTSQFTGPVLEVATDPGVVFGGLLAKTLKAGAETARWTAQSEKLLGSGGILHRGLLKIFTVADVDVSSDTAKRAVDLARKAETGSKRAAKSFTNYLRKHFPNAIGKFEIKNIRAESRALGYYHTPVIDKKTGNVMLNQFDQPLMRRRQPAKNFRVRERIITDQRALGSVRLLNRELNHGYIMSRPFKFRRDYLNLNSAKDIDNLMLKYADDATQYVDKAFLRMDDVQKARANEALSFQVELLERELGDKINMPMTPKEAFGLRMALRDLGQGVKATIAAGGKVPLLKEGVVKKSGIAVQGYRFQADIDQLRFWKLVLAREQMRSTLTGMKVNASGAWARVNTRAPGDSPGLQLLQVSRAMDSIPSPSPAKVSMIAEQLSRLGRADSTNAYLNKMFSPAGMKMLNRIEDMSPASYKAINKILSWEDKAFGAYIDALLSNPVTHVRNILDTGSLMFYQDVKEFAATAPAMARLSPDAMMHAQTGVARMHGHLEAIGDMFRIWKQESPRMIGNIEDFMDLHEVMLSRAKPQLSPRALRNSSSLTQMAAKLEHMRPTSMLGRADAALKSIEYRAALRANAMQKAHQLAGGDWKTARKLYEEFVDSPLEQMKLTAFESAEKYTYQQPFNAGSKFEKNVLQALSTTPFVRFVTPFTRTPYQIIKRGITDGPLGGFNPKVWADLLEGGTKADNAAAQIMLASGGMMYLASHTNESSLTGAIPGVQTRRGQWHLEKQYEPYSMGSDFERISFENLGPLRWIAGSAANIRDLMYFTDWDSLDGPDTAERAISGTIAAMGDPISDHFFLENFVNLVDAFARSDEPGFMGRLNNVAQQTALGFATPGAMRAARQIMDEKGREATTFLEKIMRNTPGLSDNLPETVDVLGYPVTRSYWHNFSPLILDPKNPSPVAKELRRTNAIVNDIPKDYEGLIKFTSVERAKMRKLRGDGIFPYPGLEKLLEEKMGKSVYREAPLEMKAKILESQISAYNDMILEYYIDSHADIQNRYREALQAEEERLQGAKR